MKLLILLIGFSVAAAFSLTQEPKAVFELKSAEMEFARVLEEIRSFYRHNGGIPALPRRATKRQRQAL